MKSLGKPLGIWMMALSAVLLCRCDMQTAGSSVGTGNPTEIQVAFTDGGGSPQSLSGTVNVFAATQVPVPGFQPEPLASFPFHDQRQQSVLAADLKSIPDSLWPKSSREGDSVYRFNVVVKGDSQGVILMGLGYRPVKKDFSLPAAMKHPGKSQAAAMVWADLATLVDITFAVNYSVQEFNDDYTYVPGTGFVGKGLNQKFNLSQLPRGKYDLSFVSLSQKGHHTSGDHDSAFVFSMNQTLNTESADTLSLGSAKETLPLPPLYR